MKDKKFAKFKCKPFNNDKLLICTMCNIKQ